MLKDKPLRECSKFYGNNGKFANIYQDLVTREYIVQKLSMGFENGIINKYTNMLDAENAAEDWVLDQ